MKFEIGWNFSSVMVISSGQWFGSSFLPSALQSEVCSALLQGFHSEVQNNVVAILGCTQDAVRPPNFQNWDDWKILQKYDICTHNKIVTHLKWTLLPFCNKDQDTKTKVRISMAYT